VISTEIGYHLWNSMQGFVPTEKLANHTGTMQLIFIHTDSNRHHIYSSD